jgi:hypothetical protein
VRTRAEGFSYSVAASSATDHHVTTAGGVKLYETGLNYTSKSRFADDVSRGLVVDEGRHAWADSAMYLRKGAGVELPGWVKRIQTSRDKITVTLGVDFNTLQDAFDHLVNVIVPTGTEIELFAPSGWSCLSGLDVRDGDYRRFRITAQNDLLTLPSGFTGIFLRGQTATLPVLDCLVDMQNNGDDGISCPYQSIAFIEPNMGVINAGRDGLYLNRLSDFSSSGGQSDTVQFQGAAQHGVYVDHTCRLYARNLDVSNAGAVGIWGRTLSDLQVGGLRANNCGSHGVEISEGAKLLTHTTTLRVAQVNNNGGRGFFVRSGAELTILITTSTIGNGGRMECQFNAQENIMCDMGVVSARGVDGMNAGTNAVVNQNGNCRFSLCDFSDNNQSGSSAGADQDCIRTEQGGISVFDIVTAENAGRDAFKQINGGSTICRNCNADGAGRHGYRAEFIGRIDVINSTAAGAGGAETSVGSGGVVTRV